MSVLPLRKPRQQRSDFGLKQIWEDGARLQGAAAPVRIVQVARQAMRGLWRTPVSTLLTVLSIGVAFFFLTVLVLVAGQLRGALASSSDGITVHVYLTDSHTESDRRGLAAALGELPATESVRFIDKNEALRQFESRLGGDASLLTEFQGENPLPASFEIVFRPDGITAAGLSDLRNELAKRPGVELIQYSDELVETFASIARIVDRTGAVGIAFALVVVSFVVASTVQLALYAHRDELEVMRLVGATDSYIQAPYLIEGGLQGLVGGVLGVFAAFALHTVIHSSLTEIDLFRAILPRPDFLSLAMIVLLIGTGMLLGAMGSWIATRSFLRKV